LRLTPGSAVDFIIVQTSYIDFYYDHSNKDYPAAYAHKTKAYVY